MSLLFQQYYHYADTNILKKLYVALFPEASLTFRTVNYPYSTRNVHINLSFCNLHGHTLQYLHSYFPDTIKLWNTLPYLVNRLVLLSTLCMPILSIIYLLSVLFVLFFFSAWLHIHLASGYLYVHPVVFFNIQQIFHRKQKKEKRIQCLNCFGRHMQIDGVCEASSLFDLSCFVNLQYDHSTKDGYQRLRQGI